MEYLIASAFWMSVKVVFFPKTSLLLIEKSD